MTRVKFLFFVILIMLTACKKKDDEVCMNRCPPRSTKNEKCECTCRATRDNLVNAGNTVCVRAGSFVAFLPKEDHLDTFSINIIKYSFGVDHEFLYRDNSNSNRGAGFSYKNLADGDSLVLDMMRPADFAFHLLAPRDNRYDTRQYRLRFEGFIPGGWDDGEVMHAIVHYWTLADNPVRPSIEFDMIKVTESVN